MDEKLISIIVSAYNNEKHIVGTLESIIAQDYKNLEIIFVNDGSDDGTLKIAEEILGSSARNFKIINQENNSGYSTTRNIGIDTTNGEYICFCNGGDVIGTNFVSTLAKKIQEDNCEIAFCEKKRYLEHNGEILSLSFSIRPGLQEAKIFSGDEALELCTKKNLPIFIGCIMFQKNFIIKNRSQIFNNDEFNLKAFSLAKKISFTPEALHTNRSEDRAQIEDIITSIDAIKEAKAEKISRLSSIIHVTDLCVSILLVCILIMVLFDLFDFCNVIYVYIICMVLLGSCALLSALLHYKLFKERARLGHMYTDLFLHL